MKSKITSLSFLTAAILFSLFVSISDANAQTSRRKKTRSQVVASPTPTQTVPSVVSRSDEYLDGNQIVLGGTPQTETTGEIAPPQPSVPSGDSSAEMEARIKELNVRIKSLESGSKNEYDEKQKRLLLNLDILSRAEQRAESLRKQLFEMIEKESGVRTRLEQISFDARPENIERNTAFVGSLRPEEIRDQRRKSLEAEKRNLESLMTQIQTSRARLETNVEQADSLVERVRFKLDKEIDNALADDEEKP